MKSYQPEPTISTFSNGHNSTNILKFTAACNVLDYSPEINKREIFQLTSTNIGDFQVFTKAFTRIAKHFSRSLESALCDPIAQCSHLLSGLRIKARGHKPRFFSTCSSILTAVECTGDLDHLLRGALEVQGSPTGSVVVVG